VGLNKHHPRKKRWRGVCGCCVTTTIPNAWDYYSCYIGQNRGVVPAWGDAERDAYEKQVMSDLEIVDDEQLERLAKWKLGDPRHKTRRQLKRDKMYRQFTFDIRVDFTDKEKLAVVRQAVANAARDVYATVSLLLDKGSEPQIAVYSDDGFEGHEEISIMENKVKLGHEQLQEAGATGPHEDLDQELIDAVAGVKFDKSK
jgi:hypothetical protein